MKQKMKINKKTLASVLFFVIVVALTVFSVFRGQSLSDLVNDIRAANLKYLFIAVICVLIFLIMQGVIIYLMLNALGLHRSLWKCSLLSFSGYFFCCITPFQSGGPPMQIFNMRKDGIRISDSSIVILIVTFLFKLVLVVVGVGMLIFGHRFIVNRLRGMLPVFGIGLFLTFGFSFLVALVIFHPRLLKFLTTKFFGWLAKKKPFRKYALSQEKVIAAMDRYSEIAGFFKQHMLLMIILFLLTFAQRCFYFAVTYCVYRSFGLSGTSLWTIIMMQAAISISADLLPLPGGAGISEALFLIIFNPVFGAAMVLPGMVLSRGITYYAQLVICGVMTVIGKFTFGRNTAARSKP